MVNAKIGDIVRCKTHYESIPYGETRRVQAVVRGPYGLLITLNNPTSPCGTSDYKASNFSLVRRAYPGERTEMASFERTHFFAVQMDPDKDRLRTDNDNTIMLMGGGTVTPLRHNKSETLADIKDQVRPGEKWMVFQTIALVEGEEPKPPIKVTEYK